MNIIQLVSIFIKIRRGIMTVDTDNLSTLVNNNLAQIERSFQVEKTEKKYIAFCLCAAIDQGIMHNEKYRNLLQHRLFSSELFDDQESGINITHIIARLNCDQTNLYVLRNTIKLLVLSGFIIRNSQDNYISHIEKNSTFFYKNIESHIDRKTYKTNLQMHTTRLLIILCCCLFYMFHMKLNILSSSL